MLAEKQLREGNLQDSLASLQAETRKDPANAKLRVFLFQLLALLGQWERAATQLTVASELDPGALAMAQMYREALLCEVLRAEIFAGRRTPLVFGDPGRWVALLVQALGREAEGRHAESQSLRDEAFELAPTTAGAVDGVRFEWIADADPRLGPVLEAVVNGRYYWVPFHRIREVRLEKPSDLRDLVWTPASFSWANGGQSVGLVPTRYPGSEASGNAQIVMARKTEWAERGPDVYLGLGQRMFATNAGEHPILDTRVIQLDTGDGIQERI